MLRVGAIDREQRQAWQEERARRGLVPGAAEFGRLGLMVRLDDPSVLVKTLPADPLRTFLEFDDEALLGFVLPDRLTGQSMNVLSRLDRVTSTSEALVRYADDRTPSGRWRAFAALRREGGVEVGFGSPARRRFGQESHLAGRSAYMLFVVAHAIRMAVECQARLIERHHLDQLLPMEVDVALPGAERAILAGFASGWAIPEYDLGEVRECVETGPLVRLEVEEWPDEVGRADLIKSLAQRVCDSFGVREPRFLVNSGQPGAGQLLPTYA